MDVTFEVQPSLERKLGADWKSILSVGLETICSRCLESMQNEVPVDTGRLQASLKTNFTSALEKQITSDVEYWVYVNYGTYKMAANPFVNRAVADIIGSGTLESVVLSTLRNSGAI